MKPDAEVCVVGAGAGGAVAAWALATRGIRVTLLELGPRWDPSAFGPHAQEFELHLAPMSRLGTDPEHRNYRAGPGERLSPRHHHLISRSPSGPLLREPRRRPFLHSRAVGVGGSTLHYQGEAHRFPAHAFRLRSTWGAGVDWPIDYDELAPFYDRIEGLLGVAGDPRNPFKPPRGPYPYPAHPFSPLSRLIERGARELGSELLANPVAILPEAREERSACHYCNGCWYGCRVGAKGSVDVAVIPRAEATGRLELRTGLQTARLEHAADGRIAAAIAFDGDGREQRIRAEAFVLAAGAIETPRILLNSAGGAHPRGVGNAQDQVGRHLMETLYVTRRALGDPSLRTYAGIPHDGRIWDDCLGSAELPGGFVLGHGCGTLQGPAGHALEAVDGFGTAHRKGMRSFGGGVELTGIAEQIPRPGNRVTLSDERDRFGVPLGRVETRLGPRDLAVLDRMWERLGELAVAAGLELTAFQSSAYDQPNATHVGGTCRMGDDPSHSVVDAWGAVHGVPNLVLADGSVLPTQGAGDAPSLTIQALALRAAEALAQRGRRGETRSS